MSPRLPHLRSFASSLAPSFALALALAPLAAASCGAPPPPLTWADGTTGEHAPKADAGSAPSTAATSTAAATVYPAPHAPFPQVTSRGGRVLLAPRVVTVTVAGDPLRDRLQQLGDAITQTPWWDAVTEGYCAPSGSPCIGRGASGGHVELPSLPTTALTDAVDAAKPSTIKDLVRGAIADGTFPAPTADTLYLVYLPSGASVTLDDLRSCAPGGFAGYHDALRVPSPSGGAPIEVAYAIVARCAADEAAITRVATHELVEAATDPGVALDTGYYLDDPLWSLGGGEVADLCQDPAGDPAGDTVLESGFRVQRSWSNAAAQRGGDPCVPLPPGRVYFNVAPPADRRTIALGVGESATIELDAFADAPTPSWSIGVSDLAALYGEAPRLRVQTDRSTVTNGDRVRLTLTLLSAGGQAPAPYAIVSRTTAGALHVWYGEVVPR